jgi:hypothetical protein
MSEEETETVDRKPRRPRIDLSAAQQRKVEELVRQGNTFSKIARALAPEKEGTDDWQPFYDAVRRTAIEKFGSVEAAKSAKREGREAASAA